MSYLTKKSAEADGKRFKKTMPAGWKLVVHENLGWHWKLANGPISVSPSFDGRFSCLIAGSVDESGHGSGEWGAGHGGTPKEAVEDAIESAAAAMKATEFRHTKLSNYIEGVLFQWKSKSLPAKSKSRSVKRSTNSRSRSA